MKIYPSMKQLGVLAEEDPVLRESLWSIAQSEVLFREMVHLRGNPKKKQKQGKPLTKSELRQLREKAKANGQTTLYRALTNSLELREK